jgi:hypothetical protein
LKDDSSLRGVNIQVESKSKGIVSRKGEEVLASEVEEFHLGDRLAEELAAEAGELLGGVCGVALEAGVGPAGIGVDAVLDPVRYDQSGGAGGVNDLDAVPEFSQCGANGMLNERVVGTAEQDNVWGAVADRLGEVDADYLPGYGVVDPTFFHQRHKEGAGFLDGPETECGAGAIVGV